MFTVFETAVFIRTTHDFWSDDERMAFISWVAANPQAGDVIVGSGGLRKVRWSRSGMGKRGGVRVITFAVMQSGEVWLLIAYTKNQFDTLPTSLLDKLKKEIEHD